MVAGGEGKLALTREQCNGTKKGGEAGTGSLHTPMKACSGCG
jgi:hypothetical protein